MYTVNRGVLGFVIFIVGFTVGATVATLYYLQRIQAVTDRVNIKINDQYIVADISNTDTARAKGLGGRDSIGINEGMYFIFDKPDLYGFWMKDMKIPIDLIWISNGQIVGYEENMLPPADPNVPDSELKNYVPPEPVDRVLELHAGRVKLLKITKGDAVLAKPLLPQQTQPAVY